VDELEGAGELYVAVYSRYSDLDGTAEEQRKLITVAAVSVDVY